MVRLASCCIPWRGLSCGRIKELASQASYREFKSYRTLQTAFRESRRVFRLFRDCAGSSPCTFGCRSMMKDLRGMRFQVLLCIS